MFKRLAYGIGLLTGVLAALIAAGVGIGQRLPDEAQIAYTAYGDQEYAVEIYLLSIPYRLTIALTGQGLPNYKSGLVWSPDGTRLAYAMTEPTAQSVYVLDRVTRQSQKITLPPPDTTGMGEELPVPLYAHDPAGWLPDSARLILVAYDDTALWQVYVVDVTPDSTGIHPHTPLFTGLRHNPAVDLSPDGHWLLYRDLSDGFYRLRLLDRVTGSSQPLTLAYDHDIAAGRWSPDNRSVIYSGASSDNGQEGTFVVDAVDGRLQKLMFDYLSEPPLWSPDGRQVAWRDSSGALRVLTLPDAADPTPVNIQTVQTGLDPLPPAWLPDGVHLVFSRQNQLTRLNLTTGAVSLLSADLRPKIQFAPRPDPHSDSR